MMAPTVTVAQLPAALTALDCRCTHTEAAELMLQLGQAPDAYLSFPLFVEAYDALM